MTTIFITHNNNNVDYYDVIKGYFYYYSFLQFQQQ
jgi:hypothetical protein